MQIFSAGKISEVLHFVIYYEIFRGFSWRLIADLPWPPPLRNVNCTFDLVGNALVSR
jgi:hypothetical protein